MIGLNFYSKIVKICSIFLYVYILHACKSDAPDYIPQVPVYVELNLTNELLHLGVGETVSIIPSTDDSDVSQLVFPGSKIHNRSIPWKTYGKGLILYRVDFGVYWAFDRTCTYYKPPDNYCGLEFGNNLLVPYCPCCSSKFIITAGGGPVKGSKAEKPLYEYRTSITDNNTRLIISRD